MCGFRLNRQQHIRRTGGCGKRRKQRIYASSVGFTMFPELQRRIPRLPLKMFPSWGGGCWHPGRGAPMRPLSKNLENRSEVLASLFVTCSGGFRRSECPPNECRIHPFRDSPDLHADQRHRSYPHHRRCQSLVPDSRARPFLEMVAPIAAAAPPVNPAAGSAPSMSEPPSCDVRLRRAVVD